MSNRANLVVWSNFVFKTNQPSMNVTNQHVQKIMQQQDDELSKVDTPDKEQHETDLYDENHISEALILEKVEKRFGKALPLHRMDVILLMD